MAVEHAPLLLEPLPVEPTCVEPKLPGEFNTKPHKTSDSRKVSHAVAERPSKTEGSKDAELRCRVTASVNCLVLPDVDPVY